MTDWAAARRHPWRARAVGFATYAIGFPALVEAAGVSIRDNPGRVSLLAVAVAVGATAMFEPLLRQRITPRPPSMTRHVVIAVAVAVYFAALRVVASATSTEVTVATSLLVITGLIVALSRY
jgi:hypothetical protein